MGNLTRFPDSAVRTEMQQCLRKIAQSVRRLSPTHPSCGEGGDYEGLCRPNPQDGIMSSCNEMGIKNSLYVFQLKEWVEEFAEKDLFIIPSERLYDYPTRTVEAIVDFLGVGDTNFDWNFITNKAYNIVNPRIGSNNAGTGLAIGFDESDKLKEKYPPMNPQFRKRLEAF